MINLMQGEFNNRGFLNVEPLDQGPELDDHYEFLFSVYPDDLVEFRRTKSDDAFYGYYRGFHINKGSLTISAYENGIRVQRDLSIVRSAHFTKSQVDLLGKVSR